MSMRTTFLGTGGAVPTTARTPNTFLANRDGERLLFDCGEGTQRQVVRCGTGFSVSHLSITHLHGDHTLDIPGLVRAPDSSGRDDSLAIHGPPGSKGHLEQPVHASGYQLDFRVSVHEARPRNIAYRADDYEVHVFDTEHRTVSVGYALVEDDHPGRFDREKAEELGVPVDPAFGCLHASEDVELKSGTIVRSEQVVGDPQPGRTVVYTGNTRPLSSTIEVAYDTDLLIHNATLTDEEVERAKQTAYSTVREAARVTHDADVRRFTLTHISARYTTDPSLLLEQAREMHSSEAFVAEGDQKLEVPYADSGGDGAETGEQSGGRGTGTLLPRPRAPVDVSQNAFHTVNALATAKYAGDQLATFEDMDTLRSKQMTALASEVSYSETAFIEGGSPGDGYDVRIFASGGEIPFAGHPTLEAAAVLRGHFGAGGEVMLSLDIDPISVKVRGDGSDSEQYWMTQNAPRFGTEPDRETLAKMLSLDANDFDADWPIQVVSTGLPAVMIPLRGRDALARSEVSTPAYRSFFDDIGIEDLFLFYPNPRDDANDFAARMYVSDHGVTEDPATGGANGCFAGYLARHRYFGNDETEVTVKQGYEMGRPSQLHLEAEDRGDEVAVRISGCVEFVSTGRLV